MRSHLLKNFAILAMVVASGAISASAQYYKVTNLLSDGSVPAVVTDPNFINPWAISSSGTWWMSTEASGFNYVFSSTASTLSFKVIIPPASGLTTATGFPAGSVTTGGAVGMLLPNGTKASFLFSTLDGLIAGWNSKLGTANAISQVPINNNSAGAVYPGLAILNVATAGVTSASYILAANFGTASTIEVYDSTFQPSHLTGTFTDPNLPAGYSPFGIHIIGSQIFVTYTQKSATTGYHIANGSGNGVVDIFDLNGNFVSRAVTGGNLNAPWGVAVAPASYGIYSGDLLIGNFGDGIINVYDPKTFAYLGQLMDVTGKPISNASLWELLPGGTAVAGTTSVSGGDTSTVFFTAGLAAEKHGLFGGIANATTAGSTPTFAFSASTGTASVTQGSSATATVVMAPTNGFTGTVTLGCSSGLPIGVTCSFTPAQVSVSSTAPATSTLTILTTKGLASMQRPRPRGSVAGEIATAFLFPLASLLVFRRRRSIGNAMTSLRLLGVLLVTLAAGSLIVGCADDSFVQLGTPSGTATVVVTATSGALAQQTSIALTVK